MTQPAAETSTPTDDDPVTIPAESGAGRRKRTPRPFPATSFKEALFLAQAIQRHGAGQRTRRLTLFEALDRSPDSGPTRKLITASVQYGITTGGYSAEWLDLTPAGKVASNPTAPARAQLEASLDLAILSNPAFGAIYEKYKGSRLPTGEVLRDAAREAGVDEAFVAECVETFLANARDLGLIRTIGGSEHLVTVEAAIEAVADDADVEADVEAEAVDTDNAPDEHVSESTGAAASPTKTTKRAAGASGLDDVCFVISPIGSADSVERKHADLMLAALVEPSLAELGLRAVRADGISKPGLITGQVMDHVARAALVIADLSFGNPNVYYELALRHATRKPTVQIIRTSDRLPFDVGQYRTVQIDMTDIYTLVPQIDLHRQEITRQCRAALEEGATSESPLSQFYPQFWGQIR
ncbi:hypothetical protein KVF89_19545 [Nocardioides carbamazepini]|uniref:hypothetical protein n=1 Tax=Nocardioides carbamazepini TaxID=2854259 RepID=UPI002149A6A7|nr:hypothetical protein [Nocardioides carbamazepini]MCR1784746.1 hypothetical protein [Nocardioides carbamazepini]